MGIFLCTIHIFVKLPAHPVRTGQARSGEQNVSKGSFVHIVSLDPACPAWAGRGTSRPKSIIQPSAHL